MNTAPIQSLPKNASGILRNCFVLVAIIGVSALCSFNLARSRSLVSETDIQPAIEITTLQLELLESPFSRHDSGLIERTAMDQMPGGCPSICSPRYCDQLADSEAKEERDLAEHFRRVRRIGAEILKTCEAESSRMIQADLGSKEYHLLANRFLVLSDWVSKGDAYGNAILTSRCKAVAGIAISHLLFDESFPVDEIDRGIKLLEQLNEMAWVRWIVRAHEREVPGSLAPFVVDAKTNAEAETSLLKAAIRGEALVAQGKREIANTRSGGETDPIRNTRRALPPKVAIYLNDRQSGPSAIERWEDYFFIPQRSHGKLAAHLRVALFFRQAVGGFPFKPLPEDAMKDGRLNSRYISTEDAAFSRAWFEFSNRPEFMNSDLKKDPLTGKITVDPTAERLSTKYGNMTAGTVAAEIHRAIQSGKFDYYLGGDAPRR